MINGVVMQQINNTDYDGIKYYNNLQLFSMKENFNNYE